MPHAEPLRDAVTALKEATNWVAANGLEDPEQAGAAATPYLRLMALTVVGYLWSRKAAVASRRLADGAGVQPLLESKLVSAGFYFDKILPEVHALLSDITSGKETVMALDDAHWAA